ncbi:MAG: hypothetical protein PHU85_01895 [Phycisphaerae bacterium]|nr:hypothetical protein [Phycisphaerae bacterium]
MNRILGIIAGLVASVASGALVVAADEPAKAGGAFNLRLVSDSVPDFSSRENFVRSALSNWPGDQDKCLAQFRWVHNSRRVGSPMVEDGRPVVDPILFFNSYGVTFCSTISVMNVSLWEAAGLPGRAVGLNLHCVSEVRYNNAWHMFDSDFCNYFLDEKGEVASGEALFAGRKREEGKWYLYDHCPTASSPQDRIFMGPSSAALKDVADDWYSKYKPRENVIGADAGHRFILGLRPDEAYTRYWRPLGAGAQFSRPYRDGKDPNDVLPLKNGRSNGRWVWTPNLSDPAVLFAAENAAFADGALRVKDPAKPAFAVFRVMAANVVTSARINVRGTAAFQVSGNGGLTWDPVNLAVDLGAGEGMIDTAVGGRLEFLLKADLSKNASLSGLTVTTTTQVNQRTLPALRLGSNTVVALADEHLEYVTVNPFLSAQRYEKECARVAGFTPFKNPREFNPALVATTQAELVLKAAAPRDIKRICLATTAHLAQPDTKLMLAASFDAGRSWKELGRFDRKPPFADQRVSAETRDVPPGTREVLLRCSFDGAGGGLTNAFAQVGYEPAGGFMPYDVTYCWSEWREDKWTERQHTERIAEAKHKYTIDVGGTRPPRMNWVRHSPAGAAAGKAGYSDGEDAGGKAARADYGLTCGQRVSVGAAYTVSRPASDAFPDTAGKVLTDGHVGLASFWNLDGINLTGEKNKKRVGELVVWPAGEPVVVTVDLGAVQAVGGARVAAVQPNANVLFSEAMTVEVSADGKSFAAAGRAGWEECFFPPADESIWEGADSPLYDALPAGGILDHKFAIPFAKPVQARFVRFTLAAPTDKKAGIGLWELEVYDRLERRPWSPRLQLP